MKKQKYEYTIEKYRAEYAQLEKRLNTELEHIRDLERAFASLDEEIRKRKRKVAELDTIRTTARDWMKETQEMFQTLVFSNEEERKDKPKQDNSKANLSDRCEDEESISDCQRECETASSVD